MGKARRTTPATPRRLDVYVAAAVVVAGLLVAAYLLLPGPRGVPGQPGVLESEVALDFTVRTLDGVDWTLSAQRGYVVVLTFTGAHCTTCAYEARNILGPVSTGMAGRDVRFLSIDVNRATSYLGGEDEAAVRAFATANGVTWPIALDTAGVAVTYQATGNGVPLPTNLVIGRDGIIAERHQGILSRADLTARIEALL
jgi:peroxiredoxin